MVVFRGLMCLSWTPKTSLLALTTEAAANHHRTPSNRFIDRRLRHWLPGRYNALIYLDLSIQTSRWLSPRHYDVFLCPCIYTELYSPCNGSTVWKIPCISILNVSYFCLYTFVHHLNFWISCCLGATENARTENSAPNDRAGKREKMCQSFTQKQNLA